MKTARHKVLDFIRAQRIVTPKEISRAMQMTEANARHHLAILEAQGLVRLLGQYRSGGKGRPANLFGLAEDSEAHNLHKLASALLDELMGAIASQTKEPVLRRLARRVLQNALVDGPLESQGVRWMSSTKMTLTNRLYHAINILNHMSYSSRWEAHTHAPRLIFEHCPYAEILESHPEMCRFDEILLEQMLQVEVRQTAKLRAGQRGNKMCVFSLQVGSG